MTKGEKTPSFRVGMIAVTAIIAVFLINCTFIGGDASVKHKVLL
jgi:hypothetical protein